MTTAPPPAAWDLALAGIDRLQEQLRALAEAQREMQAQLIDVRQYSSRAAPMSVVLALEGRVKTLEDGQGTAILQEMATDRDDRRRRWWWADIREWLMIVVLALLVIAIAALITVLLRMGG